MGLGFRGLGSTVGINVRDEEDYEKWKLPHSGRSKVRSRQGWVQRFVANKWLGMVLLFSLVMTYFACMMPGAQHRPQAFGHGTRQHAHVGDAGPLFLGTAPLKVPPAWSVERNQHYSLRSWINDLIMWSTATDVEPQRMGPIAALHCEPEDARMIFRTPCCVEAVIGVPKKQWQIRRAN